VDNPLLEAEHAYNVEELRIRVEENVAKFNDEQSAVYTAAIVMDFRDNIFDFCPSSSPHC
jgi:hypothetical protein